MTLNTPGKVFAHWRTLPDMQEFVRQCYYDEVDSAAERFLHSEEFAEVQRLVQRYYRRTEGRLLDIGGGNGMASLAWRALGFSPVLLEPDHDPVVGYGALSPHHRLPVVHAFGEAMPFADASFDLVYVRQVLHHIPDLPALMREVYRLLRPGGLFIATREHVISHKADLQAFYDSHPIHRHTQGENAYLLLEYLGSMKAAGLHIREVLGHAHSVINYAPTRQADYLNNLSLKLGRILTPPVARWVVNQPALLRRVQDVLVWRDHRPGRMYSFLATRP